MGERLFVVGVHLFAYAVPRAVHFLMAELLHAGKPFFVLQDPADLVRPGLDAVVGKVAVSVRRNDLRSGAAAREQAGELERRRLDGRKARRPPCRSAGGERRIPLPDDGFRGGTDAGGA